ncbi:BON domain-containing protein [Bdellovibrio sp. ZAP7]|nr:BON domain-containing protein [Bdellovibrio sp. ZAP7]
MSGSSRDSRTDRGDYRSDRGWDRNNMDRNESSRFGSNEDRESDSSPSYGSYGRDYSSQSYSDRDYSGSQSYSGRGDRLREDSYGSSRGGQDRDEARRSSSSASFEGRGPKSYTRSDDRIKEDVCEMLTRHSEIDANDIEVEVKNGEVTLSGTVNERRMKHMAEDLAERVSSVKEVTNNIRVQKESTHDWSSSSSQSESSTDGGTSSTKGSSSGKRAGSSASSTTQNPNH